MGEGVIEGDGVGLGEGVFVMVSVGVGVKLLVTVGARVSVCDGCGEWLTVSVNSGCSVGVKDSSKLEAESHPTIR